MVFKISDLSAQACGKVTYGSEAGISLPHYKTFLDSKGGLWVNSRGGGINYYNGKSWKNFSTEDGLLFSWTGRIIEDREGGIWINHRYSKGVTRYLNGVFYQYPFLGSEQDTLHKGQKEFPVVYRDDSHLFIDKVTQEVKTWTIDSSSQQVYLYTFDFKTGAFDLKGAPFFSKQVLEENFTLLKSATIYKGLTYWDNNQCVWLRNPKKKETIFLFENGEIHKLPFYLGSALGYKSPSVNGEPSLKYKAEKSKLFLFENNTWNEVLPPELTRYGDNLEKISIKFRSFHHGQRALLDTIKYMFCTVWELEGPDFPNQFILAEHDSNFKNIIQTTLFNEIPSQVDIKLTFVKDKAGTYWYTNGHGIVRLFPDQLNLAVDRQGLLSNTWGIAGGYGDRIWFSAYSNTSTRIALRSFDGLKLDLPPENLKSFFRFNDTGITDYQGFNYFISSTSRIPKLPDYGILKFNQKGDYQVLCPSIQGFFLSWDRHQNLLFGTRDKGLWVLPNGKNGLKHSDWKKYESSKGLRLNNVLTALEDKKGRYWMGRGSQGLSVYLPSQDTIYNWVKEQSDENLGVQSMTEDHQGNMWFGTEKGLSFFKNNVSITPDFNILNQGSEFVASDYLGESLVQVCKVYDEHTLIIGNEKGYFLLDLDAWYAIPRKLLIYSYNSKNGNLAGQVNQNGVYIDHNKDIWFSGNKGIVRFNPSLLKRDSATPIISLDSLEVGNDIYKSFNEKISLKSTQRTVRINFSHARNPLYHDNIRFRYRLSEDDNWSTLTDQTFVEYLNLSAGNYTFEVMAEKNGLRSDPKKLTFRISEVLWRKPLFWMVIFSFLFLVALYSQRKEKEKHAQDLLIEKNKVEMANLKKEKEKLQVQAIVNQLNPHFINNALQWLQVRLDNNDDQEAVSVVGKLSENISTVFKNSRDNKAFHSLYNEMRMVQNYLFIQKRRFKDKLQYDLPGFNYLESYEKINIPLLMIQIHVENAVEHGIRNKKEGGIVKVIIETLPKFLVIKIEDDGVGRKAAQKIGSKGTQNGVKMLKELETIFNKQNEIAISQTFEDDIFTNEKGIKYGTRMIIQLPKTYNYNL